jgi:hypothetical protein
VARISPDLAWRLSEDLGRAEGLLFAAYAADLLAEWTLDFAMGPHQGWGKLCQCADMFSRKRPLNQLQAAPPRSLSLPGRVG